MQIFMQKRCGIFLYVLALLTAIFLLAGCESASTVKGVLLEQAGATAAEPLDVVMLGTHGYTTVEDLGITIEDYDTNGEYDSTALPPTETGFRLTLPIAFYNQGTVSWYDARATLTVTLTTPDGKTTNITLPFVNALVQRRRYSTDGYGTDGSYLIKAPARAEERRLSAGKRRVFFFETSYTPAMAGVYALLVELRSPGMGRMRIARSGFTVMVKEPSAFAVVE